MQLRSFNGFFQETLVLLDLSEERVEGFVAVLGPGPIGGHTVQVV